MATSGSDSIFGLATSRIEVPPGSTQAVLFEALAGQNSVLLKYFSGGTLEILGVSTGVTLTAVQLAAANQSGYLMGTSEILALDGPVRCYLSSTGATTTVMVIRGKTAGT